jgi:hypothetical protein
MNHIAQRWSEMIPIIAKGIEEAENGIFAISEIRLRESYGISDDDWHAMLMINKEEERFIAEKGWDWTFRLLRS